MKSENKVHKKNILLKLTGEIIPFELGIPNLNHLNRLAAQIKLLNANHFFGIVIGGGNIARGSNLSKTGLKPITCHYMGMVSTCINGLIVQDVFNQLHINSTILTAFECQKVGTTISPQNILKAKQENDCIIFCGGTGNPYFTTDTAAVLRALEIDALEIWKATKVDGIYDKDPLKNSTAKLLPKLGYNEAIEKNLGILDHTALTLAKENKLTIKVFNAFNDNCLIQAASNNGHGSIIKSY